MVPTFSGAGAHAERCVKANLNILSLHGERLPYNICRNLEWQTCAAQGKLPGQGTKYDGTRDRTIKFAKAPGTLELVRNNRLGVCSGWVPSKKPEGGIYGYATDDIFYLETCLYSQVRGRARANTKPNPNPNPSPKLTLTLTRCAAMVTSCSRSQRARALHATSSLHCSESYRRYY